MTEHTHTTFIRGCFRCELHKDEIRTYIDSLMVTRRGIVHDPDCSFVTGTCSSATRWTQHPPFDHDRACSRCLPDGIPTMPEAVQA